MKIKICGMKYRENIKEISDLNPDFLGFIFYPKSPRYIGDELDPMLFKQIPKGIKKVAVFVNSSLEEVVQICRNFKFDYAQLHGDESAEYCENLKKEGVAIIKAFPVDEDFDFAKTNSYKTSCKFFLFDTKTIQYGGSGTQFNWKILKNYDNEIPFFLSGGIGPENFEEAFKLEGLNIAALDLNSKFEIEPGRKSQLKLSDFAFSYVGRRMQN